MKITGVIARPILSSAGNQTIEVTITDETGKQTSVGVPAGISAGKYEVAKVSVAEALEQIRLVKSELVMQDFGQETLDAMLISKNMGGNATLAVSAAFWRASKNETREYKWPKLLLLLFEGGKHGNENIAMQEFAIIEENVEGAALDYRKMREHLETRGVETLVGAEGGFSPGNFDDVKVLETINEIFPEKDIALDAAGCFKNSSIDYDQLLTKYRIASIEDPFSDEEWSKWQDFYVKYGERIMVMGDDLTVTNLDRIRRALSPKVINAVIIKPNQVGTISGAKQAMQLARDNKLATIVSHRGEETDDDWIVDFALETQADYVKFGGTDRGERIAKYNRLKELGMK